MSEDMPFHYSGKAFATNLKRLRKSRGLTQEDLGNALGVKKSCISNYEKNVSLPDVGRIMQIASFFNITDVGELLGYTPPLSLNDSGTSNRNVPVVHKVEYGKPAIRKDNIIDEFMLSNISNIKPGEFLGFIIPDNSMLKSMLKKGDIAVVCQQNIVASGEIGLVAIENRPPVIRKVYIMDNTVTLTADCDGDLYPPVTLNPMRDNFEIVGKIVCVMLTY